MKSVHAGIVILVPLLAACAAGDDTGKVVAVDSAGTVIVTVPEQVLSNAPVQELSTPAFTIGGGAESDIAWVVSAIPLADGRVAFVNGAGSEIRIHRIGGDMEVKFGRSGDGPGEFRVPWRLFAWPGDSLLVWDVGLRRASIFALSGELGRTFQVPNVEGVAPEIHGVFPNGQVLTSPEDRYKHRDQNQVRRDTITLYRLRSSDLSAVPAGRFAGQEQYEMEVAPVVLLEEAPFGARSFVGTQGDNTVVADGRAAQISVLDSTGVTRRIVRLSLAGQPVTAEARSAFEDANVDDTWRPTYLAAKRQFVAEAPIPSMTPGMGEVIVGPHGSYWVSEYVPAHDRDSASRTWWEVTTEGQVRRRILTPERFNLLSVGDGYLIGTQRDELDVESVVVYSIE